MSLMKWVQLFVVDSEPQRWAEDLPNQVQNIMVGDILGLNSDLELVMPHDPKVTKIGVVVLVGIQTTYPDAVDAVSRIREHPIFTDGDTYRRLSIPMIDRAHHTFSSIVCSKSHVAYDIDVDEARGVHLSIKDGEMIKQAITEKFGDLE